MTTPIDWDELQGRAASAPDLIAEAKRYSPYQILVWEGVSEWVQEGGRLLCRCPFHDDSNPSFAVYGENWDRCGCWACGLSGDVLDLLGWMHPDWGLREKMNYLSGVLQVEDMPEVVRPEPADMEGIYADAHEPWVITLYVDHRDWPFDREWLENTWQVRGRYGEILIPHFDPDMVLTGLKHRDTQSKPKSYTGSRFTDLYGCWLDDGSKPVILCEGESDCWVASYWFQDHTVLGLPSGASQRPIDVERFDGRQVYLWFDGDDPGRKATERWTEALLSRGAQVLVIPMADGCDVASLPNPRYHFNNARPATKYSGPIAESSGVLVRNGRTVTQLSDWVFRPERVLRSDEGDAYEGIFMPSGVRTVLTTPDLTSAPTVVRWANGLNGAWFGSTRDAQEYLAYLHAQSVGLPVGHLTRVVGLHSNSFVLPNEAIGTEVWRYAPPAADVGLSAMMHGNSNKTPTWEYLDALRNLHTVQVMDPILAWFGLAPVRSRYREFPLLMVSGSAGTGKTTLVETVATALCPGVVTTNLTATTPYAIDSFVASTNGVPVWFDEYRPGGRKDTIERLNQIMRDAYTSQPSYKGGASSNLSELRSVVPSAPIVISGEDLFSETSHLERAIVVAVPRDGREPGALRQLLEYGHTTLWYDYVSWLLGNLEYLDYLHDLGTYHENPRINTNLSRLHVGWETLRRFLDDQYGFKLGEPDFNGAVLTIDQATQSNPILDMIRWAVDEQKANPFQPLAWEEEGDLYISLRNVIHAAHRNGTFTLPGGPAAVKRYIMDAYRAYEARGATTWGNIRYLRIPDGVNLLE